MVYSLYDVKCFVIIWGGHFIIWCGYSIIWYGLFIIRYYIQVSKGVKLGAIFPDIDFP